MLLLSLAMFVSLSAEGDEPAAAPPPEPTEAALRGAIEKSLPLLLKAALGHRENRTCFACHNQGVPLLALAAARERGFKIDNEELKTQTAFIAEFLGKNRGKYLEGKGQGGQADTAGYALWALAATGYAGNDTTAAVAEYLLQRHSDRDHWQHSSNRPPSEAGPFTTTYVALYGLQAFGTAEQQARIATRNEQVRGWLLKTPAKDTEDRVFRLLALEATGAPQEAIETAAKALLEKQHPSGGWSQLDGGEPESATEPDAYATGSALVALHQAGGLATTDAAYQRGLAWLLKTQQDDGSWHVVSRSKPFQTYFESGFPHGKDQFLSCAASSWATWAMVLACPKAK
jgi:squalene cyclase